MDLRSSASTRPRFVVQQGRIAVTQFPQPPPYTAVTCVDGPVHLVSACSVTNEAIADLIHHVDDSFIPCEGSLGESMNMAEVGVMVLFLAIQCDRAMNGPKSWIFITLLTNVISAFGVFRPRKFPLPTFWRVLNLLPPGSILCRQTCFSPAL